jgi:hypothetical protein
LKDFYGWDLIAARVSERMRELSRERPAFIITPSASLSSFLGFLTDRQYATYLYRETLPDGRTVGEKSNNVMGYIYWQNLDAMKGRDALFVTRRKEDDTVAQFRRHVAALRLVEEVPILHRGQELRRFFIYHGTDFRGVPAP